MAGDVRLQANTVIDLKEFAVASQAFDEAWSLIGSMFAGQPEAVVEDSRDALAHAVLNAAAVIT